MGWSLAPWAGSVWESGGCGEIRSCVHQSGTVGRSRRRSQHRGQVPLPLPEGLDGASVTCREHRGDARGWAMGAKPSLRAPSRQGNRATGCQCSLCERHTCREELLSPLKNTQEDLFPRTSSYLGNSHHGSKAECLFGNKKMRYVPKSVLVCRHRGRKFEDTPEAVAGSQQQMPSWMGWRPGQLVFAACLPRHWLQSCQVSIIFLLQHKGIS